MSTPKCGWTWDQWHSAFGHVNMRSLTHMVEKSSVVSMDVDKLVPASEICVTCIQAKHHITPFPQKSNHEYHNIGDITFTDLWGPAQMTAIGRYRYVQSFKDGKSCCVSVHFLMDKTDESIISALETYHTYILTQKGKALKNLHADNEFAS